MQRVKRFLVPPLPPQQQHLGVVIVVDQEVPPTRIRPPHLQPPGPDLGDHPQIGH